MESLWADLTWPQAVVVVTTILALAWFFGRD